MTRAKSAWDRTRDRDWRWLGVAAIAVILMIAYLVLGRDYDEAGSSTCRRLYAAARTEIDSAGADAVTPMNRDPKFAGATVTCGTLRRLGRLR
jgi:hypothetical protein